MNARPDTLLVRAHAPARQAGFWADLLGWERDGLHVRPTDGCALRLRFEHTDAPKVGLNQAHLHLTGDAVPQDTTVARALELGATHVDVGQLPEEDHVVLADPDGNEFCVIPGGNRWLAGTGFLGELGCDGTREVGLFWSAATGWPLVWDEDGETAIQPPEGGIKIAWGGPPLGPRQPENRFVLELAAADPGAEAEQLVGLGAGIVGRHEGVVVLTDPDGNELRVVADR